MWRARHLQDDRLYECFIAGQTGEPVDPPAADHLADCLTCQERYAELSAFMGELRADADVEVDEIYSADALRAQQAHVLRRIEHLGHAARVISFPKHQANGSLHGEAMRVAPRWLAAAAAAGLIVGVGVGTVLQSPLAHRSVKAPAPSAMAQPPAATAATVQPVAATAPQTAASEATPEPVAPNSSSDTDASDEFFGQMEFALERARTPELVAFDELTPHAREVRFSTANYR